MDTDDPLANLDPEIAYALREIGRRMNEYAEGRETGIPEIIEKLKVRGYKAEVNVVVLLKPINGSGSVRVDAPKPVERKNPLEEPSRADLKAANEMGISIEEVVAVEAEAQETAYEAVVHDLREMAPKLSPRVRNWVCSYISHTFPQLSVRAPGPEHLKNDKVWIGKLGDMISKILTLSDPQKELQTLLSHMERLKSQ